MALWLIERDLTGWSEQDRDAGGLQAKLCTYWYPEMTWLRSYFDRDTAHMTCLYQARSEQDIRDHARVAGIPCDRVHRVEEIDPALVEEPPATREQAPAYQNSPAIRLSLSPARGAPAARARPRAM
jgi:hypothetical protein